MPTANVIMPDSSASVLIADPAISVAVPENEASVLLSDPAATVMIPDSDCAVVCDDQLAETFTTPTLTSHSFEVTYVSGNYVVTFTGVTAGSPCRVRWVLSDATTLKSEYSSPDQNSPHIGSILITDPQNMNRVYDLKWSWTSGNEHAEGILITADAVFVGSEEGG